MINASYCISLTLHINKGFLLVLSVVIGSNTRVRTGIFDPNFTDGVISFDCIVSQ